MILPTKRLRVERSLLGVGGELLRLLEERKTVSRLWDEFRRIRGSADTSLTFDWFILALDLLFMLDAVKLERGLLRRVEQ